MSRVTRSTHQRAGRTTKVAVLAGVAAATTGMAMTSLSTVADAAGSAGAKIGASCPAPYPAGKITDGMVGTGLTVDKGSTPAKFSAQVIGVVDDGIGPGTDMIIVKTASPAIKAAGGIWAGMSGSPVYAADGRLLGAVSYSMALGQSNIAGLTPAAALYTMLNLPNNAVAATHRVSIPAATARQLVAAHEISAAQAGRGLTPMPLPVAVSGQVSKLLPKLETAFTKNGNPPPAVFAAGAKKSVPKVAASDVKPGGTFVAGLSYGDVTVAAGGTTTLVCQGKVVAFGHSVLGYGQDRMFAQTGQVVYVQSDPVGGNYMVFNVGGTAGRIDQDRLFGVRGLLGNAPTTTRLVATMKDQSTGISRTGTTYATEPWTLASIAGMHSAADMNAVILADQEGTAVVSWVLNGHTKKGPFTISRADRFSTVSGLSYLSAEQIQGVVGSLTTNPFMAVTIDSVVTTGTVTEQYRSYSVDALQVLKGKNYVPVDFSNPISGLPGSTVQFRVHLTPYRGRGTAHWVPVSVRIPAKAESGELVSVYMHPGSYDPYAYGVPSFAGLLQKLNDKSRSDQLQVASSYDGAAGHVSNVQLYQQDQVLSGEFYLDIGVS